jgi:hypothetical protein
MRARRTLVILLVSLGLSLVTSGTASAQYPGRFSTFGYGPRVGPWFGPGLWGWYPYYPGAVGSFWSNGLSLYGPPVPTQGPIPGSFGGGDARQLYYGNSGYGLFWLPRSSGVYGAARDFAPPVPPSDWKGPRFGTRDVKRRYEQDRADPQSAIDRAYRDVLPYSPRR